MQYDYPGRQLFEKEQVIPPALHNGLGENASLVANLPPTKGVMQVRSQAHLTPAIST
jgi:hypothetical protein